MGLALVRLAGEQIRRELGEIRRKLACQVSQKYELIEKLCGPKEHLLLSAKAALDLACMSGQTLLCKSGSERCKPNPLKRHACFGISMRAQSSSTHSVDVKDMVIVGSF